MDNYKLTEIKEEKDEIIEEVKEDEQKKFNISEIGLSDLKYYPEGDDYVNIVKSSYSFFEWNEKKNFWDLIIETNLGLPMSKLSVWDAQYIIAEQFTKFAEKEIQSYENLNHKKAAVIIMVYHPVRLFISLPVGFGTIVDFRKVPPKTDYLTDEERKRK